MIKNPKGIEKRFRAVSKYLYPVPPRRKGISRGEAGHGKG
jgi:hypothetical protein